MAQSAPHRIGLYLAIVQFFFTITIAAEDIQPSSQTNPVGFESAVLGIARYAGEEITVLRVDNLFAAAMRRTERRRRRI